MGGIGQTAVRKSITSQEITELVNHTRRLNGKYPEQADSNQDRNEYQYKNCQ
jgi:hypothetical protein